MNSEVRLLFHELAGLSREDRERVLAERPIEPEVRAELESLLSFDGEAPQSLTDCVSDAAQQVLGSTNRPELGFCGPYRLVRLLGSGGMGAVYLGERRDGEIQQRVAVKLLRADAHRPAWRDRFLKERQILASLNHPSIVHVVDAGHTGDGRPYLVMEYVEGAPIDVYAAGIEVRERLTLFLRVCDGVAHAHRHLIIHRDLKPSNILVDASGQPKLLDFGIAKLLDETGNATQTIERLLTPNYASPEQLSGTVQTTAADVYSLGAVLYKLLTGRSPHESETGRAQAIDVIFSQSEVTAPSRLNPNVPTDLDYVLRKALRKEPEERYASVEAFANDIRAFLESRPVEARSGNAWYRTRKFLQRYRATVAAAALVIASLSAGLYVANRERAIAQRRFQDVRQLANKLFDIDVQARQLPGSTTTRQLIVDTSLEYLRRLAADARGDPELALEVGNAYMRVARVQGVPTGANLGQMDQAEQNLQIAEAVIQSVVLLQPSNRTAVLRAAQIAHDRMILARLGGRSDEALALARKSAEWLEKFHASIGDKADASGILNAYLNVADQFKMAQQFEEALRLCSRGTEIARLFESRSYAGDMLWVSADVHRGLGDLERALQDARESEKLLSPGPGDAEKTAVQGFAQALIYEGWILGEDGAVSLGRPEDAAKSLERAFRIEDDLVHKDPLDQEPRGRLAMAGIGLADIVRHADPRRALDIYEHTLRHLAEIKGNSGFQRYEVNVLAGSSYALRSLGRSAEARQRLDGAFERLQQLKLYPADNIRPGSEADETLRALADHEADTGNLPRALQIYNELLEGLVAGGAQPETSLSDAVRLSHAWESMAGLDRRAGRANLAFALEARRMELWHNWDGKLSNNTFVRRQLEAARLP